MDFEAQKEALERKEIVQNYMEEKKISELFQVNNAFWLLLSLSCHSMVNASIMDFEAQKEALERKTIVKNYIEEKKDIRTFPVYMYIECL